jgi:hypothetical protein
LKRIANGTKASSPAVIGHRRNHRSFNGIPYNSEGSRTMPFFVNINQRDSPFASMTGGVITNYKYAKELLGQRAQSSAVIDSLVNELPPPEGPLLQLNDVESKSLELNALLNGISDEVEAGNVTSVIGGDLKNVLRLYVALLPTFDGGELADFQRYFQEVEQNADVKSEENPQNKTYATVRDFMSNLFKMTAEYAPFANRSQADKVAKIRELLKRFFRLNKKEIQQVARAIAAPPAAEGGDDDGLPPPPRPGRGQLIAEAPQPDAVVEEALGVPAEEGGPPLPPAARGPAEGGPATRTIAIKPKQRTVQEARAAEEEMKQNLRALTIPELERVYDDVMDYPVPLPAGVSAGNIRSRILAKLNRAYSYQAQPTEYYRKASAIASLAENLILSREGDDEE